MNEKFFKIWGKHTIGCMSDKTMMAFKPFANHLPNLDGFGVSESLGSGADGRVFRFEENRVIKFGVFNDWRGYEDLMTNVSSAVELMDRLEKLLETDELCLPKVHRLTAFDDELYAIEMEHLPFDFWNLPGSDYFEFYQHEGLFRFESLDEPTLIWQDWMDSYDRFCEQGYVHRDILSMNIRGNFQEHPKFIDLESFVHYLEPKQLLSAAA